MKNKRNKNFPIIDIYIRVRIQVYILYIYKNISFCAIQNPVLFVHSSRKKSCTLTKIVNNPLWNKSLKKGLFHEVVPDDVLAIALSGREEICLSEGRGDFFIALVILSGGFIFITAQGREVFPDLSLKAL